ncbi:MAG: hypothetical protein ACLUZZ_07190, partial [Alistipes inops]
PLLCDLCTGLIITAIRTFHQRVDVASNAVGDVRGALDVDLILVSRFHRLGALRGCGQRRRRHVHIEQGVLGWLGHLPGLGVEGVVELDDGLVGVEALALYSARR